MSYYIVTHIISTINCLTNVALSKKNEPCFINRLHARLTRAFSGVYKEFFPRIFSHQAIEFFIRYPVPEYLKEKTPKEIASVLSKASKQRPAFNKAVAILKLVEVIKERPRWLFSPLNNSFGIVHFSNCPNSIIPNYAQ